MNKPSGQPSTTEELQEFISARQREISDAEIHFRKVQEKNSKIGRILRPTHGAKDIDDETLAKACRSTTIREIVGLIADAAKDGFVLPLELVNFNDKTLAEVIYLLQQQEKAADQTSAGE